MWPWSRNKLSPATALYDTHNHLLPGVDDGAPSLEHALDGIGLLTRLGYRGTVITPHIYREAYDNTEADLRNRFDDINSAAAEFHPAFRLQLGAEYLLDEQLTHRMCHEPDALLVFGHTTRHMLVELPMTPQVANLNPFFDECARLTIRPIIAHAERYPFIQSDPDATLIQTWRSDGALIQINAGSIVGQYGPRIEQTTRTLWDRELVDLIGTDMHDCRKPIDLYAKAWRYLGAHARAFDSAWHHGLFPQPTD